MSRTPVFLATFALILGVNQAYASQAFQTRGGSGAVCTADNLKTLPFVGQYEATYENGFDDIFLKSETACFKSFEACENWRYDIQSEEIYYVIYRNICAKRSL